MKFWKQFRQRSHKTAQSMARYQEASVYAQAGGREQALELLQSETLPVPSRNVLLVLVQGSEFSPEIREYALNMAQRLGYEIMALNTAPIKRETWQFLDLEQQHVRQEFQAAAESNFSTFQQEAAQIGISIEHRVKFIDKEEALEEVQDSSANIEFVISNAEPVQQPERNPSHRPRPEQRLCVYSLAY